MDVAELTSRCQLVLKNMKTLSSINVRDDEALVAQVKATASVTFDLGKWLDTQV